ncbi:TAXI family TRAP transporter solute-binding subunit [Microbispora sp. NPDC088329]|uniref:TAXI family TRAP transporter solute-binding subunit n=1 Tax=Microbispora sp. NPDC088329 TaxID=3154869 RepID=UPI00344060D8
MRRRAVVLAPLALLAACAPDAGAELRIAAGVPGGVYDVLGRALGAAAGRSLGVRTRVVSSSGALENLSLVRGSRADVGFVTVDVASLAPGAQTSPGNDAATRVMALARVYDDCLQVVVDGRSRVRELSDLREALVATGPSGSGTELLAMRVLTMAGVTVRQVAMGLAEAVRALESGRVEAFFFSGGLPTPAISSLAARRPIRLISLGSLIERLCREYRTVYKPRTIGMSAYRLPEVTATVAVPNLLLVAADMSSGEAEALTRVLLDNRAELARANSAALQLNHQSAILTMPVPLHPGAEAYYRSAKIGL